MTNDEIRTMEKELDFLNFRTTIKPMTTTEAKAFITKSRKLMNPWLSVTESQAVRDLERSSAAIVGGMLLCGCATYERMPGLSFLAMLMAFAVLLFTLRLRQARRILS